MKRPYFFLVLLFLCTKLSAQKDFAVYGKIDKADLELKACAFDSSAEAMVLFDVGEVYCRLNLNAMLNNNLNSDFTRHVRIKILSDKGLTWANIKIPYRSEGNLEDITNISAQTINLDASGNPVYTKVEKDLIYRKRMNKRYSEVIFTFPEVKKGSIIEYKYVDKANGLYALKNWYFQRPIPVNFSRYTTDFPPEIIVSATHKGVLEMNTKDDQNGNRNVKTYSMKTIPALRDEPYMACNEDYMEQVIPIMQAVDLPGQFRKSMLRTWPGIVKELMEDEDFGVQLRRNIPRTADLEAMLEKVTDPYQKMVIIYYYVRKNMQWNEYYGIWALDGVRSAWKDKKGTSGEINLILVNLLKDADLVVHPMLVSTKENGMVNTSIAGISQFNKVMAYVEIGKDVYVLDATNKYNPVNLIPDDVICSEGLVIEKLATSDWGWKTLLDEKKASQNTTILMAGIDDKGIIKGEANIISSDYSRQSRIPILKEGKQKFISNYFSSTNTGLVVDSFNVENEEIDSLPLRQHVSFTHKTSSSGDYHYFSPNLFSGLEKNPFIADNRLSDVFFGSNQKYSIIGHFTIPENFQFEELPKNIKMIMPDTSIIFSRLMGANGNKIDIRIHLEIKKPFYSVNEYPYFQEFYKKLFELLNEQIVFKKK